MLACVTITAWGITLTLGGGDMIIYLTGGELKINCTSYLPPTKWQIIQSSSNNDKWTQMFFEHFSNEIFLKPAHTLMTLIWLSCKKVKWSNHDLTVLISG